MKTLRQLFVVAMLAVSASAMAQDDLRAALIDFVQASPSSFNSLVGGMDGALNMVNKQIVKDFGDKTSEQLVADYMDNRFVGDMIDYLIMPAMVSANVTADEVKQATAVISAPEGKPYYEHLDQISDDVEELDNWIAGAAETLMASVEPDPIEPVAGCPQEYIELFNKYYDLSDISETPEVIDYMEIELDVDVIKQLRDYVKQNQRNFYLECFYGTVTADDLRFGIELHQNPTLNHVLTAAKDMSQDSQQRAANMLMSYIEWLRQQGVKVSMDM